MKFTEEFTMSIKWLKDIHSSIGVLNSQIPSISCPPSVHISSYKSPTIGKNWQNTNMTAIPSRIFICWSMVLPGNNRIICIEYIFDEDNHYKTNVIMIKLRSLLPELWFLNIASLLFWNNLIFLHVKIFIVITASHGIISTKTTLEMTT